jgi:hypothetical protein
LGFSDNRLSDIGMDSAILALTEIRTFHGPLAVEMRAA